MVWLGDPNGVPVGRAFCDGANGTPDLGGWCLVSYDAGGAGYGSVNVMGGSENNDHTVGIDHGRSASLSGNGGNANLSDDDTRRHRHHLQRRRDGCIADVVDGLTDPLQSWTGGGNVTIGNVVGTATRAIVSNMPPSDVPAFILRVQ